MEEIRSYRDLVVWQKAMDLVVEIYRLSDKFPKSEVYGMISQMRRAAVSIPSNIAEGKHRGTRRDFRQFILIAYGSGAELETQLEIVKKLRFVPAAGCLVAENLLAEVMRMLNKLAARLKD